MFQSQLNSGSKVKPNNEINEQKRLLLKEISLPSNEDFSRIENYISHESCRRKQIRLDDGDEEK